MYEDTLPSGTLQRTKINVYCQKGKNQVLYLQPLTLLQFLPHFSGFFKPGLLCVALAILKLALQIRLQFFPCITHTHTPLTPIPRTGKLDLFLVADICSPDYIIAKFQPTKLFLNSRQTSRVPEGGLNYREGRNSGYLLQMPGSILTLAASGLDPFRDLPVLLSVYSLSPFECLAGITVTTMSCWAFLSKVVSF